MLAKYDIKKQRERMRFFKNYKERLERYATTMTHTLGLITLHLAYSEFCLFHFHIRLFRICLFCVDLLGYIDEMRY